MVTTQRFFLFFFLFKNMSLVALPGNYSCTCTSHPICNTQEEPIHCDFHNAVKYIHIRINFMSLLHFMQQLPLDLFNPDSVWLHLNPKQWQVWTYGKGKNCERFPHLFCKVIMWHLNTQKNLVQWRQWEAVLKQKAMFFTAEEWHNPDIHLEKEVKNCFSGAPSFFHFDFLFHIHLVEPSLESNVTHSHIW